MSEKPKGFANLSNALDLLCKLRHDRTRMNSNIMDTYAAFDFFVTAEHMVDWLLPDVLGQSRREERKGFRNSNRLLQITSDIASGAKHFQALAQHHDSVDGLANVFGGFDPQSFSADSFCPGSFKLAGLNINLNDGSNIHALTLADDIIEFWSHKLEGKS
jgi:hypothetical protein